MTAELGAYQNLNNSVNAPHLLDLDRPLHLLGHVHLSLYRNVHVYPKIKILSLRRKTTDTSTILPTSCLLSQTRVHRISVVAMTVELGAVAVKIGLGASAVAR